MAGLFAPDSVIRRVDSEAVLLLGGGRAILMQLAHPAVAAGVAQHSDFEADPFGRLAATLNAVCTIVFGDEVVARRAAAAMARVHERVAGPGYRAGDPELLLWVHATLVDTALRIHRRFLTPLSPDDAERYYQESKVLGELLGVPLDRQPEDLAALRSYVRHMVATLEVSDDARRVAGAVLNPPLPLVARPLAALVRQITVGLCPPPLRAQYHLDWDLPREAALLAAQAASRMALPRVPAALRRVPLSA